MKAVVFTILTIVLLGIFACVAYTKGIDSIIEILKKKKKHWD